MHHLPYSNLASLKGTYTGTTESFSRSHYTSARRVSHSSIRITVNDTAYHFTGRVEDLLVEYLPYSLNALGLDDNERADDVLTCIGIGGVRFGAQ